MSQRVLNAGAAPTGLAPQRSASALALELQLQLLSLQGTFMAEDGSGVDYPALVGSKQFRDYCDLALELQTADLATLTDEVERRCFFLNLYNALTVHGIASADWASNRPASVLDLADFWKVTSYQIGDHVFSLDDMEHGILRGNRPHPAPGAKRMFSSDDPRGKFALPLDARVHFALVCGAKGCPPIRVFKSSNLERGLQAAATNFCDQTVDVNSVTRCVTLSKILDWYSTDFGCTQVEVLRKVAGYMSEGRKRESLEQLLDSSGSVWAYFQPKQILQAWRWVARPLLRTQTMLPGPLDIKFEKYDWSLNHKTVAQ